VSPESLIDRDYKLVFTNGVFDAGLTLGHIRYLQQAKKQGDKLVVAINSNDSTRRIKGTNRPVLPLEERKLIVAALEFVDYVLDFDEDTPLDLIKKINPDLIVKGGDYKIENIVGNEICPIFIADKIDCVSTSKKIEKLIKN